LTAFFLHKTAAYVSMRACMRTMKKLLVLVLLSGILLITTRVFSAEQGLTIKGARFFSYPSFTRIVFEIEAAAPYVLTRSTDGHSIFLAAYDGPLVLKQQLPLLHDGVVGGLRSKQDAGRLLIEILLDAGAGEAKDFVLRGPDRIVIDVSKGVAPPPLPQAGKTLVIVLDPGHGGRDTGIMTAEGPEKTMALDFAFALWKVLRASDPRFSVIMTREKDQSLGLDDRAAAANASGAALFLSIHEAPGAGARVYIQDLDDGPVAQPASAPTRDFMGFEAMNEQHEILWGGQQASHVKESGSLGRKLMRHLGNGDRAEPVQAPLPLLRAVDAAAVLIELGSMQDRSRAIEAVSRGIEQYVRENP